MPEMEDGEGGDTSGKGKQSRSEKKSRKAMAKLGMKPVPGIIRVTVKKSKNILFVIKEPDVFKTSSDNPKAPATYIVFGKAEIEDLSAQATSAAVEQFKAPGAGLEVENDAPGVQEDVLQMDRLIFRVLQQLFVVGACEGGEHAGQHEQLDAEEGRALLVRGAALREAMLSRRKLNEVGSPALDVRPVGDEPPSKEHRRSGEALAGDPAAQSPAGGNTC